MSSAIAQKVIFKHEKMLNSANLSAKLFQNLMEMSQPKEKNLASNASATFVKYSIIIKALMSEQKKKVPETSE